MKRYQIYNQINTILEKGQDSEQTRKYILSEAEHLYEDNKIGLFEVALFYDYLKETPPQVWADRFAQLRKETLEDLPLTNEGLGKVRNLENETNYGFVFLIIEDLRDAYECGALEEEEFDRYAWALCGFIVWPYFENGCINPDEFGFADENCYYYKGIEDFFEKAEEANGKKSKCYGALVGDYQGSVYEFEYSGNYDFDFDNPKCKPTDDSVMTLAVLDLLLKEKNDINEEKVLKYFKKWYSRYPGAGFGGRFSCLMNGMHIDNRSWGNGAPMRISPVGWLAKSEEEVKELSRIITSVSHNHPESYKAAEVTAMMIFKARNGATKEDLVAYAKENYTLFDTREALVESNHRMPNMGGYGESCMKAMPEALSAFALTNSFDECLRTIVSCGGDCDTTGAIACSIAEAFYGGVGKHHKELIRKAWAKDQEAISLLNEMASK